MENRMLNFAKHWTPEDDAMLVALRGQKMRAKCIAEILGRSKQAIEGRSRVLHLSGDYSRPWSPAETIQVAALRETNSIKEIAEIMGRSVDSIAKRLFKIARGPEYEKSYQQQIVKWPAHARFDDVKLKPARSPPVQATWIAALTHSPSGSSLA